MNSNILIIDDEAALRQTFTRILQRAGFSVTSAASAKEGLSLLAKQSFDMTYLDIRMPDMNGLEALKTIHKKYPEMPVILFTAQPDMNSALDALRNGAKDYLLKPLKPQALIERTKAALADVGREKRKKELQSQIANLQAELMKLENKDGTLQDTNMPAQTRANERYIKRGDLTLDLYARRVIVGERTINLPPTSFDYLLTLARHSPNVVDYQTLIAEAQGYESEMRDAQELSKWHVHHIRQAIESDVRRPTRVINVRGVGYRLVAD